jgi:hypothetical protein
VRRQFFQGRKYHNKEKLCETTFVTDVLTAWMFTSILVTMLVLKLISANDKLERKKYMEVCRLELEFQQPRY